MADLELKPILKSQYHAALAMLRDAVEKCPDDLWTATGHLSAFWQVAYHTVFFTHLYLHRDEASFEPWAGHQRRVQHQDGLTGRADPESALPQLPDPYSKAEVLSYWQVCDDMVPEAATAGSMGFDDLKWLKPVRPGDVLSVESVVRGKSESRSRPDRGTVKIESRVSNQRGEVVMSLVSLVIYLRRP